MALSLEFLVEVPGKILRMTSSLADPPVLEVPAGSAATSLLFGGGTLAKNDELITMRRQALRFAAPTAGISHRKFHGCARVICLLRVGTSGNP